jgi:hypothetical protein
MGPRAFSAWRNSIKRKSDRVLLSPGQITIQTTAQDNPLEDASLTVDAATLLPVSARFVFAPEDWIEISVIPSVPPQSEIAASHLPTLPKPAAAAEAHTVPPLKSQSSTELAVWLLADRLSDPTGEPIRLDIHSGIRISVTPYSLNAIQLQQLSASLRSLPGVDLHIPNVSPTAPEAPVERDPAINLSETIFSRAHLLATLAEHFPDAVETTLSPSARIDLWQLRSRHASQLNREIQSLEVLLNKPGLKKPGLDPLNDGASLIERLVLEARKVNRSVIIASVPETMGPEVAGKTRADTQKLTDELAQLKSLANQYANSIALGLESSR